MAAAAGTGIVKEAAASSSDFEPAAGGGKAKLAGTTRRTQLVPVGQDYIDDILEYRASVPSRTGPVWNEEMMARFHKDNPEALERSRSLHAKAAAIFKADEEMEDEILKQYNAGGSAFMEIEVSDDDN